MPSFEEMLNVALEITSHERHLCASIFTQPKCEWSKRARALLIADGYAVWEIDISLLSPDQRAACMLRFHTVPQVIVNGKIIGGLQETIDYLAPLRSQSAPERLDRLMGVWS